MGLDTRYELDRRALTDMAAVHAKVVEQLETLQPEVRRSGGEHVMRMPVGARASG